MKEIKEEELKKIQGGFSITGATINAIVSLMEFIMDVGRSLGNSFRRMDDKDSCCA